MTRYAYGIAFHGQAYVMVYNPRRAGWEMPGGKVEKDESDLEGMHREFREETGHVFLPFAETVIDGVTVFAGEMGERVSDPEMEWREFTELPSPLSFAQVEYLALIAWGREERARRTG
jgi:8-oxo-dGTP diphosphatase